MPILPDADSPVSASPTFAARMARTDACPDACGNTETPYRIENESNGFRAFYGCSDCGQFWNTGWGS